MTVTYTTVENAAKFYASAFMYLVHFIWCAAHHLKLFLTLKVLVTTIDAQLEGMGM